MRKPHKALAAPRVYNPLEDFHLYPLLSAAALSERRVYRCDLPMVYGVTTRRGRVLWRKVWKRKR